MSKQKTFDPTKPVVVCPGPTSPAGKAIASRNATKHGCCADTLILKSENPADFKSLEATWFKAYAPSDDAERHLVQELVHADWYLQRSTRTVTQIESELLDLEPNPLHWTDAQQRTLGRFLRYQTTRANNVKRAQKAIEDYRRNRLSEHLRSEKLTTAQRKNKPEPTWKEHLDAMRQKAIELGYTPPDPTQR